ncbi:MAG: glycosyltransferase [Methanogenium sp.]|jgi:hypothetical protein
MDNKTLCIIIPVFNQLFYTKKALESIGKHEQHSYNKVITFVVDNASTDDTKNWLTQEWCPSDNKYVIWNDTNLGYGPAINKALCVIKDNPDLSDSDILLMNNDMELLPNCIDKLKEASLEVFEGKKTGVVGGKLLFPDGIIQHGGAFLSAFGWGQHKLGGVRDDQVIIIQKIEPQEYVTGALFFITNECLKEIGLLDERFAPAYFEEVDYCFRVRDKGYQIIYTPFARAIHYENITSKALHPSGNAPSELSHINQVKFYLKRESVPYIPTSEQKLLICSQIHGFWSFATVMKNFAKGLARNGVDVAIAPQDYHTGESIDDWEIKQMVDKPHDWWDRAVLRSAEGDDMTQLPPGKIRVAHTTGENSRIPPSWISQLNHVDKVLTTSTFFKGVMENSGVKTPIYVVPNAVDVSIFNQDVRKLPVGDLRGFNFVSMFHFGSRKAPEVLLKAFAEEFAPDEDVSLTIHSLSMQYVVETQLKISLKEWVSRICGYKPHAPIYITTSPMQMNVLGSFYKNFDIFVLPTRCEGFGLPLAEAAACGLPSIVTGYSGVLDIVDDNTGWLLDYTLQPMPLQIVPYFKNYLGGVWAEPSVDHLRKLMRHTFKNRDEVKKKGKLALEKSKQFSIEEVGKVAKKAIFEE